MSLSYACPSYDRFIGLKINPNTFNLYSQNISPFKGLNDSIYSQLIRKNLFGDTKPFDD